MKKVNLKFSLSEKQEDAVKSYFAENKNLLVIGPAGTGKTALSLHIGIKEVLENHRELVIIRSIVPVREIGYLPGSMKEKVDPYFAFYHSEIVKICGSEELAKRVMKSVTFMPTSFLRGSTIDNACIIVDEFQNMTLEEIHSAATRVGDGSQIIFSGDKFQTDLYKGSGYNFLREIVLNCSEGLFETIEFTIEDVIRSVFVYEWLKAYEKLQEMAH